ncbi:hypothetical protein RUND412_010445 [Rhizina undulata]
MSAITRISRKLLQPNPKLLSQRFRYSNHSARASTPIVKISEEVQEALATKKPVVALESCIYTHGYPQPENLELGQLINKRIRSEGAVPATIAILHGVPHIGMTDTEFDRLCSASSKNMMKVSRRDLPYITGISQTTGLKKLYNGGTTVAATMILAEIAGIKVFATGGIGGVHRGAYKSFDISADLRELGRTNVAVVCSGAKAFLDLKSTLEYLETEGVMVATFGEMGIDFPAFYSRSSGIPSPRVIETPQDAAAVVYASHRMGLKSGQLFCNPIPAGDEIPIGEINQIMKQAIEDAENNGLIGAANTPYVLKAISEATLGRSQKANTALVLNNAKIGAQMAVELAKLEGGDITNAMPAFFSHKNETALNASSVPALNCKTDILVVGSIAVDVSCDAASAKQPSLNTSNPAKITESLGGVGDNVALAAQYFGAAVRLVSCVGDDISGKWVLEQMKANGMDTRGIKVVEARSTARYVACNDSKGNLFTAAADMSIIEDMDREFLKEQIAGSGAKWVCFDGNLSPERMKDVLKECKKSGAKVVFEPTSKEKSQRIFSGDNTELELFPSASIELSTPNFYELSSMYEMAQETGLLDTSLHPEWFRVIDNINVDTMFRLSLENLERTAKIELFQQGLIQQAIQLSPYIPTQFIKLGSQGVLAVRLLEPGHEDLKKRVKKGTQPVVSKGRDNVGGIWIKHYPVESVSGDIVSVNGVGDTFLGALLASIAKVGYEELGASVEMAQKAAVLTLMSREAVSRDIGKIEGGVKGN